MIAYDEIMKRIFILGVTSFAVLPRQFIDHDYLSIGGDLAHSFRQLLLILLGLNLLRLCFAFQGRNAYQEHFSDALGITEVVGLNFLCFLTPYILQQWLCTRINIGGGRPGRSFIIPLYMSTLISIVGVVLSRIVHPNLWCLKKVANLCSGPVILHTLKQYNSVTHIGGHKPGRGSIASQSLALIEVWYFMTQFLCAIGYGMNTNSAESEYSQWDHFLKAFREASFVSDWTRIYAHANFINQLDELYLVHSNNSDPGETEQDNSAEVDSRSTQLVPLVQRKPVTGI